MTLLSQLPLHHQIAYRPPTDDEVRQLEIEAFNQLILEAAVKAAEEEALQLRFELEVARIYDLTETGCFWSMMQAECILGELHQYLQGLNTPQARRMLEDLWKPELGFPDWFSQELENHLAWGDWEPDGPWDFLYQLAMDDTIADDELEFFY